MAQNKIQLSLTAAGYPLSATSAPRTTFIPGYDTGQRVQQSADGTQRDTTVPRVLYMENVMPTPYGVTSARYTVIIPPTDQLDFDQVFSLRDEEENTVLFSPSHGKNYIYNQTNGWVSHPLTESFPGGTVPSVNSPNAPATARVTHAYVDGKTFVCYSRLLVTIAGTDTDGSILYWNSATTSLVAAGALIKNLPFSAGKIDGISSSNGYLLVWSGLEVAWAPFDGTSFDFAIYANGAITSSGYSIPEDIRAPITALLPVSGGFIIATKKNMVAASYHSSGTSFVWAFKQIPNAGGIGSYEQATIEGSSAAIYAYTTTGLRKISLNSSEESLPDVSDFLSARKIETWDAGQQIINVSTSTLDFFSKLTEVGGRFLVISYGMYPGVYSFALVFDQSLRRWGKLRIPHRDCFYYSYGTTAGEVTYHMLYDVSYDELSDTAYDELTTVSNDMVAGQHGIAFLQANGQVVLADWSRATLDTTMDEAVCVVGKLQLSHSRYIQLNTVELDGAIDAQVTAQVTYAGASTSYTEQLVEIQKTEEFLEVGGLVEGKSINLAISGTFALNSIVVNVTAGGRQ